MPEKYMPEKRNYGYLALFLVVCYGVAAFGAQFPPGEWYQSLNRAPWNPPNFVFPLVWTILYAMIAVAGWIIFSASNTSLKQLWVAQLVLNGVWSWLFFGQHWVGLALLDIVLLAVVLALLVGLCFRTRHQVAGVLLAPYLAWILLATSLNTYIFWFN